MMQQKRPTVLAAHENQASIVYGCFKSNMYNTDVMCIMYMSMWNVNFH